MNDQRGNHDRLSYRHTGRRPKEVPFPPPWGEGVPPLGAGEGCLPSASQQREGVPLLRKGTDLSVPKRNALACGFSR
jgi:hypothetical protein